MFAVGLLALISCNNNPEKKEAMSMTGAYKMLSQSMNDGKKDTTSTSLLQLKIYTDDFMMYANVNPADSVSGFGIGSYTVNADSVMEHVIYNASGNTSSDSAWNFTLLIEKTAKGYKQVIPDITRDTPTVKLTEDYETVGTAAKSPLDGAWKEIKNYTVKGKDTVINKIIQYKTYYAGHFMFGHTYTDSTNKLHAGTGYGTFEMNGNNKVKEQVTATTYSQIRGKKFDIDIEMNGTDEFKQTITGENGQKDIEIYQRMKK
jgi:hypothetical protein